MEFSFEEYAKKGLLLPLAQIGIAVAVFVLNIISLVYCHFENGSASIVMVLFALGFMFLVMCKQTLSGLKHTWYLITEREWDAVVMQGEVQDVVSLKYSPNYCMPGETTAKAALLTIDGEELYLMSADGLAVGKALIIRYLPKSRVVLSWRSAVESPFEV